MTGERLVVGRSAEADWSLPDREASGRHFELRRVGDRLLVRDLESTNGTSVNGVRLLSPREVEPGDLIRAGNGLFVVHEAPTALAPSRGAEALGLAGRFHAGGLFAALQDAAASERHLVLVGPRGVGKAHAAGVLGRLLERATAVERGERFGEGSGAEAALFGVGAAESADGRARPGLLERQAGGLLFLDGADRLPAGVRRALWRFAADPVVRPAGGGAPRRIDVRLALGVADEEGADRLEAEGAGVPLRRVRLPPLAERRADLPGILGALLRRRFAERCLDAAPVVAALRTDDLEALCLGADELGEAGGLDDLAAALAERLDRQRIAPATALHHLLLERLPGNPVFTRPAQGLGEDPPDERSAYERRREVIVATWHEVGRDLGRLEAALRARGIPCSRRGLTVYLERWGERAMRLRGRRRAGC